MTEKKAGTETAAESQTPLVEITYYTDPLCCWSWAFEPQWRRLRYEFEGLLKVRYAMGGLLPDWNSFSDPINSVSKPLHMGPIWMEAQHLSGMPVQSRVWFEDPPASSFPPCLAVKCAELQSQKSAEVMLRRLREAVMLNGRNIGKPGVLQEVANEIAAEDPELLDPAKFEDSLKSEEVRQAFRNDLQQAGLHKVGRFPTLTLKSAGSRGVIIVGYRPYEALLLALEQVAPGIKPVRTAVDAESYLEYWGDSITKREIEEACGKSQTKEQPQRKETMV